MQKKVIAVIGAGEADKKLLTVAEEVGRLIAQHGAQLICGGLGGIMKAAAGGAKSAGGTTVGILPGLNKKEANQYIDISIATGLGEMRNALIVRSADVLIAVGGEYGTLSEIALGLKIGKPVVGLHTWDIEGVIKAEIAEEAVKKALALLK